MKQAVVIIHGVGDQVPMETLRGFVNAVLAEGDEQPHYFSKPDDMSDNFELRRLQTSGSVKTHFYEYYWAYHVEGTKLFDVLEWLVRLTFRNGRDVPAHARGLWIVARTVLIALGALALTGVIGKLTRHFDALNPLSISWLVLTLVFALAQGFLIGYLGDAARYLSPQPKNIKLRQQIRADGMKLLRTLHERGEYDRIVLVGHSLGSVIGYDILTRLWLEFSTRYPGLAKPEVQAGVRACMAAGGGPQPVVRDQLPELGEALAKGADPLALEEFRRAQIKAFREQKRLGNAWCVSDFITLGSPLTNAMLFLAGSAADFEDRKRQRELPTCPPRLDDKGYTYSAEHPLDVGEGRKFTPLLLHHAAPFAVTRWTNFFFPARLGLFGDFVGGPLQPALGNGILDIPVRTRKWRASLAGPSWRTRSTGIAATPRRATSRTSRGAGSRCRG